MLKVNIDPKKTKVKVVEDEKNLTNLKINYKYEFIQVPCETCQFPNNAQTTVTDS